MEIKFYVFLSVLGCALAFPYPYPIDEEEHIFVPPPQYRSQQKPHAPVSYRKPHIGYEEEPPPKPYQFDYGVHDTYTGANYGHSENSDGNAIQGSYQVALPDGRIQTVEYVADHVNGFQAKVSYEGEAKFPEHVPEKNSYGPNTFKHAPSKPVYKSQPQSYKPQPQYLASEPEISYQPSPNQYEDDVPVQIYRPQSINEYDN